MEVLFDKDFNLEDACDKIEARGGKVGAILVVLQMEPYA